MPATISADDLIRLNPGVWLETYAYIRTTRGKTERFKRMNILQRRILAVYLSAMKNGRPCRVVGLKPRKKGFSTMVSALHYAQLMNYPHEGVVVGNKLATSQEIFDMIARFAATDEFKGKWGSEPTQQSTEKIEWAAHEAKLTQETANSKDTCRGKTPQFLHGTEVAHWESGDESLTSALNAIPDEGFNCVFLESTPYGATGTFAEQWNSARWPTPDETPDGALYWKQWESLCPNPSASGMEELNFVRVFAAWYEFEGSRVKLSEARKRDIQNTLDAESWYMGEKELIQLYGNEGPKGLRLGKEVTDCDVWEQLAWRRMIIQTKCKPKIARKFDEEYPRDPKSCFLASGRQVFDSDSLAHLQILSQKPRDYGQIIESGGNATWMQTAEDAAAYWRWEKPRIGCRYIIPVDLSEGEDQTKGKDPDRHSALVLRDEFMDTSRVRYPIKIAARVRPPNRVPIIPFARMVYLMALYYGNCVIIPEMNNSGLAFIVAMRALHADANIWQRKEIDPHNGTERRWDGWRTTDGAEYKGLRSTIIWHLHEKLRQKEIDSSCPNVHLELSDFVDKNGRMEAGSGHDDDVITLAIGVYNIDAATIYTEAMVPRSIPRDLQGEYLNSHRPPDMAMNY